MTTKANEIDLVIFGTAQVKSVVRGESGTIDNEKNLHVSSDVFLLESPYDAI